MKVLKYENRKNDGEFFDISTSEKEEAAYRRLFKELDEYWQCYSDLEDTEPILCDPCKDGQHKYCQSQSIDCTCVETPECKVKNWRRRSVNTTAKLQKELYNKAKTGDARSIKRLMVARRDNEYESVWEIDVIDPLEAEDTE